MRTRVVWLFPVVGVLLSLSPVHAIPVHDWSKRFGDDSFQYARSVATDGSGNVFLAGSILGVVDFGGGPLPYAFSDVSLAKFDVDGNHLWSKKFGDFFNQNPQSLATDGSGNVIVTGFFGGTVDFGGGPLTWVGFGDLFIAKFDANGNHLWSKSFGSEFYQQEGMWVATDGAGNVIVTAEFAGTIDFGGGPLSTGAGSFDVAVVKFDANGNHVWSQRFGDDNFQASQSVAVDGASNIVITGFFSGTVDFGGGPLTTTGLDMFVAKFDAGGSHLWSQSFAGASGYSVATDGSGNVVTTGGFNGTVDFGGGPLTDAGNGDIFVAAFDLNGGHLWSQSFGNADFQYCKSVATDGSDNVVITGSFPGTIDFGGGPLASAGYDDIFVAKFNDNGNHLWSQRFGDDDWSDTGTSVAADGSGNVVITGDFPGTVDFGGGPLTSAGGQDIFLARFMEDEPIPVLISRFEAMPVGVAVEIQWELWSDEGIERITLYRADDARLRSIVIMDEPFDPSIRSFVDTDVEPGETYHYELLVRTLDGDDFLSPVANVTVDRLATTLGQNFPNPFNPRTTIEYTVGDRSQVAIEIYNAAGARVVLLNEGLRDPGTYRVDWDGRDSAGQSVGSGVYFYRLDGVSGVAPRKMVLLK